MNLFLWFYLTSYVVALVMALACRRKFLKECEKDALIRGWPLWLVRLTRCTQHFTLYAQGWLIVALWTEHREYVVIAMVLETVVFILYQGIVWLDPTLLAHDEKEFALKVTRWIPPLDKDFFSYLGLQIQHFLCPLHLWISGTPPHHPEDQWWILLTLVTYVGWNHLCWKIQGIPPYPLQQILLEMGVGIYLVALSGCFLLTWMVSLGLDQLF